MDHYNILPLRWEGVVHLQTVGVCVLFLPSGQLVSSLISNKKISECNN